MVAITAKMQSGKWSRLFCKLQTKIKWIPELLNRESETISKISYIENTQNKNGSDDNFSNMDLQQFPAYFRSHFINQDGFFVRNLGIKFQRFGKVLCVLNNNFFGRIFLIIFVSDYFRNFKKILVKVMQLDDGDYKKKRRS